MSKPAFAATKKVPADNPFDTPAGLVCLTLALAVLVLAGQIVSIW
jgi:hypothetical protein